MRSIGFRVIAVCAALAAAACSGQNRPEDDTAMGEPTRDTTSDTSMTNQRDTTGNVEQQQGQQQQGELQQDTTQQQQQADTAQQGDSAKIALGKNVFTGNEGGANCSTCHGQDAKGTAQAPDLTDQEWIHGDGSVDFIKQIVREGVPNPKEFDAPMPAFQSTLSEEQIDAVATYVRSVGGGTTVGSR
jgi:cbb3-type cytochrome c oxidase subunit III